MSDVLDCLRWCSLRISITHVASMKSDVRYLIVLKIDAIVRVGLFQEMLGFSMSYVFVSHRYLGLPK